MTIYITMIIMMIIMFSAAWLTMPLTTLNVFFSKAYPMSVSPSIDFLLRWDHHLHHHHHHFFCLQFHRSNGVVHVHVWLCQAVQPPSLLKSADYLLNTGDYPGIHSQVSFRYIWWWWWWRWWWWWWWWCYLPWCSSFDNDYHKDYHHYCHHDKSHDHNVIFFFQHYSGELCCDMYVGRRLVSKSYLNI